MSQSPTHDLEAAVHALRAIREQKLQDIADIDRALQGFLVVLGGLPDSRLTAPVPADAPSYVGVSIPKAAEQVLRTGGPATTRQIADALRAGGIRSTAKNFEATVYSRLVESTNPQFRRTPDGRGWWIQGEPLPTAQWGAE
jgi:hypothetical protein